MNFPRLMLRRSAGLFLCTLGLVQPTFAEGESSSHRREVMEAIRSGLPKYNSIQVAAEKAPPLSAPTTKESVPNTFEQPTPGSGDAAPKESGSELERPIALPKVIVGPGPMPDFPILDPLPRLRVPEPQKAVKIDEFTAPDERNRLLVEKHLTPFDRLFLNRWSVFGTSKEERARDAELRERNALLLNQAADLIEASQYSGGSAKENRALREEYLRLLRSRPR